MFAPGLRADLDLIHATSNLPLLRERLSSELADYDERVAAGDGSAEATIALVAVELDHLDLDHETRVEIATDAVRGRRGWLVRQTIRELADEIRGAE